jgi:Uma2 family endonuclease
MSPDDRWYDVNDKLTEYFGIGVQVVWVADPQRKQVHVYRSLTEIEILSVEDTLSGGEILPGFDVAVAELFE